MNDTVVRLVAIRETPLEVAEVLAAVEDAAAGGVTVFVGTVRDHDDAKAVSQLGYSAHPTALGRLEDVVAAVAARHPVRAVAAVHRVGDLAIGDLAVVTAVACAHRGEAFEACRTLIDELKSRVPIWKHQVFSDASEEWVGLP